MNCCMSCDLLVPNDLRMPTSFALVVALAVVMLMKLMLARVRINMAIPAKALVVTTFPEVEGSNFSFDRKWISEIGIGSNL